MVRKKRKLLYIRDKNRIRNGGVLYFKIRVSDAFVEQQPELAEQEIESMKQKHIKSIQGKYKTNCECLSVRAVGKIDLFDMHAETSTIIYTYRKIKF